MTACTVATGFRVAGCVGFRGGTTGCVEVVCVEVVCAEVVCVCVVCVWVGCEVGGVLEWCNGFLWQAPEVGSCSTYTQTAAVHGGAV